jgi:1-aminocyclopropane-1-carboxylate deaminase/D-cysteine desulfhydrase-like pyridoxal-dependent ACC family enzyme
VKPEDITPLEEHGGYLVKRDDLFGLGGSYGGKVRSCWALATATRSLPAGLVTAAARHSPQAAIVAGIAAELGIGCRVHTAAAAGPLTPELELAEQLGATVLAVRPGYNSVICKAARLDADSLVGWREIPFGMECAEAVEQNARQAAALPLGAGYRRIVVPVGSGMSLAGILQGLRRAGNWAPVLGVMVGADRAGRLDRWAPWDWRTRARLCFAGVPYQRAVHEQLDGLVLDPIYEAKCAPFLRRGDLLWVVGVRAGVGEPVTAAATEA